MNARELKAWRQSNGYLPLGPPHTVLPPLGALQGSIGAHAELAYALPLRHASKASLALADLIGTLRAMGADPPTASTSPMRPEP